MMTKLFLVIVVLELTGTMGQRRRRPADQRLQPVEELQVPASRRPSGNGQINPQQPKFGRFVPIGGEERPPAPTNRKPLRFPASEEETRRSNFIDSLPPRPRPQSSRFQARPKPAGQSGQTRPKQASQSGQTRPTSGSSRPLQNQPNRPIVQDYDYDYDPLPSGPTRAPPLPSGPTRRPGQPTRQTGPDIGVPRDIFNSLPLLTTQRPRSTATPRANVNFLLDPPTRRPAVEPNFQLPAVKGRNGFLVSGSLDILDQTSLFTEMDPHQEQFIKTPKLNAGALPLAVESSLPLGRFPPFNNPI